MAANAELNDRKRAFVREYVIDFNATRAAVAAGYSKRTAKQQASRLLLTDVDVRSAIESAVSRRAQRTEVTAARVVARLAEIGFPGPDTDIEMRDQLRALDILAKHTGVYREQILQINILQAPQWIELQQVIVQTLERFPQAKGAVVKALEEYAGAGSEPR